MIYRLIFSLAALYNIAFGIWACIWPAALFAMLEMAAPNYPSLWQCLGMVVGLYGILYVYAAIRLDRAKLIIVIGLAGKILGPIGMFIAFQSGEWPGCYVDRVQRFCLVVAVYCFPSRWNADGRAAPCERAVQLRHSQLRCRSGNVVRSARRG